MSGIFISYRREDAAGYAGRLYDRLRERFGSDAVFIDVSAIEAGTDFVQAIEQAVSSCDVLVVLIGRAWLSCTDGTGRRRLENPDDFVKLETATALYREVRVIPVLIDGAAVPSADALPDELRPLARRQAVELRNSRWDVDIEALIVTLERTVPASRAGESPAPSADETVNRPAAAIGSPARRWPLKAPSLRVLGVSAAALLALALFVAYYFLSPPAELVATLEGHDQGIIIRQLVPLPDGRLASASADRTAKIWNLLTLEAEATLDHGESVEGLVPLPGERIVSVDGERTVRLWDLRTGKVERTLEKSESQLGDDVIPLGEERFAVGTRGGVKIWNVVTGRVDKTLKLDDDYLLIQKLALLRDGRLATGDHLGTVRIWNLISGEPEVIVSKGKGYGSGGGDGVTGLTELKDGRLAFATWSGKQVTIWSPTSGKKEKALPVTDTAHGLATLKDGRLAVLEGRNLLTLWNPTTGKRNAAFHVGRTPDDNAFALTQVPDGRLAIQAGGGIQLWKLR